MTLKIQMNPMKKVLGLILIGVCTWSANAQSPWLYKKNKGFFQVQTTFLVFPYESLVIGKRTETVDINREVSTTDVSAYFEYGLSDRWNVIGKIPVRYVSTGDETGTLTNPVLLEEGSLVGLSNIELALKRQLIDKRIKVATSLRTVLNTIDKDLSKGLVTGYNYNAVGIFGHVGGNIGNTGYAFMDAGYMKTSNDFSDYFQQHFEGGRRFGRAFWVRLTLDIRKSLKNGEYDSGTLLQTGLSPNDQEWIGFGFGVAYETKNQLGFNFSSGGAFDAKYIGLAAPVTIGVYKKM